MPADDLSTRIGEIEKRLNEASQLAAEKRMGDIAQEAIASWEKKRLALVVVALAMCGVASYYAVVERISDFFAQKVYSRVDDEIKAKTAAISVQDPSIADLRNQVSVMSSQLQASSSVSLPKDTVSIAPIVPSGRTGFAFFGIRDESGQWTERYFDVIGGGDQVPKLGDRLRATGSVNVRRGYIVYGSTGWINRSSIGVLRPGDFVRVDEIREVVTGFWWIGFTREPSTK